MHSWKGFAGELRVDAEDDDDEDEEDEEEERWHPLRPCPAGGLHELPGWLSAAEGAARSATENDSATSATTSFFMDQSLQDRRAQMRACHMPFFGALEDSKEQPLSRGATLSAPSLPSRRSRA